MVYSYKEMVFSNKKEFSTDTFYNMDEPWKHVVKESRYNRPHIIWFYSYKNIQNRKSIEAETRLVFSRAEDKGGWGVIASEHGVAS